MGVYQYRLPVCISVQQPWATFILEGFKSVENRSWYSSYKGLLLIHASAKFDKKWESKCSYKALNIANKFIRKKKISRRGFWSYPMGKIVGCVLQTGCDDIFNNHWCMNHCFYHRYELPLKFNKPVKMRGQLRIFFPKKITIENFHETDQKLLMDYDNRAKFLGYGKNTQ